MNYSSLNELAVTNVRALLGARRESIDQLASSSGIPKSTLNRRLHLKSPFTLEEIESISVHFKVNPSSLITKNPFDSTALADGGESE